MGGVDASEPDLTSGNRTGPGEIRATVAVLKSQISGGDDLEFFCDAVGADIINHMARYHDIGVVARQSAFTGSEVSDLRAFARDVGAQYLLESSVSSIAGTVRLRFQLIDAETGRNLWAARFDRPLDDVMQAVDDIVGQVVIALTGWHGEIHRAEFKSVNRKRDEDLNAFEHFVLGCDLELQFTRDSLERAIHHLDRATTLDPTFARAWLVYALALQWANDVTPDEDGAYLARAQAAYKTAFTLMPSDPVTMALSALRIARETGLERARDLLDRAKASMGVDVDAMVCVATSTAMLTPDGEAAMALFDQALAANPTPPFWFPMAETRIAFLSGEYERCLASARAAPPQISVLIFECLAHAMRDDPEACRIAHERLLDAYPHVDFAAFADEFPVAHPAARARYDEAVARLELHLAETERDWPKLRAFAERRD